MFQFDIESKLKTVNYINSCLQTECIHFLKIRTLQQQNKYFNSLKLKTKFKEEFLNDKVGALNSYKNVHKLSNSCLIKSSLNLTRLKVNLLFKNSDAINPRKYLDNVVVENLSPEILYEIRRPIYHSIVNPHFFAKKSFVLQLAQRTIIRTLLSNYWTSEALHDIHNLYDFTLDNLESNINHSITSKQRLIEYILGLFSTIGDPVIATKIKNSKVKAIFDLTTFKSKPFANRLTWELLQSKAKVDKYKAELFFLKNIFNNIEQSTVSEDVEFFYALISLLIYTEYINYGGTLNFSRLKEKSNIGAKKRLLEFAALSFKLITSELIAKYIKLN